MTSVVCIIGHLYIFYEFFSIFDVSKHRYIFVRCLFLFSKQKTRYFFDKCSIESHVFSIIFWILYNDLNVVKSAFPENAINLNWNGFKTLGAIKRY